MADWVQEGDDANSEKIVKVKEEADVKINALDNNTRAALVELKKSLHTQRCVVVKTGKSAGLVYVDGSPQSIPANTQKVVSFSEKIKFGERLNSGDYPRLTYIGLTVTDMSSITDMSYMFYFCQELTSLDLTGLNTSAVTSMENMFDSCYKLTSLDLSSFDTSAVTSMNRMFNYCESLISLTLGSNFFKAKSVSSIDFSPCSKWVGDTVVTSLVTNSYDRASAGLSVMTLKLHANTKAALTDEQKAAITAKGYTIA